VNERREVNQLDDDREIEMTRAQRTSGTPTEQRHERAQSFAAAPNGISDITFNRRIELSGLRRNAAIHFVELRLDRLKDATQRARHAIGSGG
jgi:hypothetical protein